MPSLIDSDVLIDISQGKPAARAYIDALPERWAISQVSALEHIVGARDQRELAKSMHFDRHTRRCRFVNPSVRGIRISQALRETSRLARF